MSERGGDDGPPALRADGSGDGADDEPGRPEPVDVPKPTEAPLRWYLRSHNALVVASRDVLSSFVLVSLVGLTLFGVSGVWPPMVAIESNSMTPNMHQGDLVVVVEDGRFASERADATGVVTEERATDVEYDRFGRPGSVIVYEPHTSEGQQKAGPPIIHRAMFYVEAGEDWTERADPQYLDGYDDCEDIPRNTCPAPNDGYITLGDKNPRYDQVGGQSTVVKPEWIQGRAFARVPYLGCIRLAMADGPSCRDG